MTSLPGLDCCDGSGVVGGEAGFSVKDGGGEVSGVEGADDVAAEGQLHGSLDCDEGERGVASLEDVD
jgi:hypothetical protein